MMLSSQILFIGIGLICGWVLKWVVDKYFFEKSQIPHSQIITPKKVISSSMAMELIRNFQKDDPGVNSGHLRWNDFNNYLKFIKDKVESSGKEISGIEYFFGRYGENEGEQSNQQTLVFFPTYDSVIQDPEDSKKDLIIHIPFDPDISKKMRRDISIREIYRSQLPGNNLKNENFEGGLGDSVLAYNRSQMSPPRPPDTL